MQLQADRLRYPRILPPFRRVLPSSRHRFPQPEPTDAFQDCLEQPSGDRHLSHLEDHTPGVRDNLGTDLDQLVSQSRRAGICSLPPEGSW